MFYLFAGYDYYPQGGVYDFRGSFLSLEEAIDAFNWREESEKWAHIATPASGNLLIVAKFEGFTWVDDKGNVMKKESDAWRDRENSRFPE